MTGAETRTFSRVAAVLLLAGVARWGYETRRGEPLFPADSAGVLPELLRDSREERAADERRRTPLAPDETLDPNRAPAVELDRLPGVGPSVARAIVAEREAGRFFATADDLERVRGIGPVTLERIRPHLDLSRLPPGLVVERLGRGGGPGAARARATAAARARPDSRATTRVTASSPPRPPPPLDVNRADARALEALPGIGPALAARIVASREAEGPFDAVEDLQRVRGIGPATVERLRPLVRTGGR